MSNYELKWWERWMIRFAPTYAVWHYFECRRARKIEREIERQSEKNDV